MQLNGVIPNATRVGIYISRYGLGLMFYLRLIRCTLFRLITAIIDMIFTQFNGLLTHETARSELSINQLLGRRIIVIKRLNSVLGAVEIVI